jgi:hypothetical protein
MKTILLLALSAIILSQSYGFAYGAEDIVTVVTDTSTYEEGDMINISGSISDYDESDPFKNFDITLRLIAPNNNIINISQIPLDSDGSYSTFIPAQGPLWKSGGDYTISVSHGSDRNASTTFTFILSEAEEVIEEAEEVIEEVIEITEEEQLEGCGEGTHLEDGVCVLDETVEPKSGSSPTTGFSAWVYSISFTILIAFAIMIILYAVSRASKNKT